jgi:hypothetical protein
MTGQVVEQANVELDSTPGIIQGCRVGIATIVAAFVFATRAYAQFEGIVESKNTTIDELGRPQEFVMTMWIKNGMVRIETRGASTPTSTMIYRTDLKKIWMLNEDEKSYFEILQEGKGEEVYSPRSGAGYSVKRTGKKRTIAGYECEQFIIKRETEETELWGTKKLGHLVSTLSAALGGDQMNAGEGAVAEVMKRGIYPLRSTTKVEGQLIESQEVTRIEAKTLDPSLFTLPADFKKMKTVDMMQETPEEKR